MNSWKIAGGAKGTWVTDLLFWLFLVIDVFGACYWPISWVGALLVQSKVLASGLATVGVLILSAVLTPVVLRGIIVLIKRTV